MKKIQNKRLLLASALVMGLIGTHNAFASETVTIPLIGDNWHCTARDNHDREWTGDGHDYDKAKDDALDKCQKHSDRPRTCEVHREHCHH